MHFVFRPPWWGICLVILSVCLFTRLGVWQWQRALDKEAILHLEKKSSSHFSDLSSKLIVKPYEGLFSSGHFDKDRFLLLDNLFYQHQVGFDVLTLFKTQEGKHLLVDLGWVPANQNRKILPPVSLKKLKGSIKGAAYFPSKKSWVLSGQLDNVGSWPLIIEKIDISTLERLFQVELYPFILRLDKTHPNALVRDWKVVTMKPVQHKGYAFQWFSFAFAALIIFIVLTVERRVHVD